MTGSKDSVAMLAVAVEAARTAGGELLGRFGSDLDIQWKTWQGEKTVVTDADFAADQAIRTVLARHVPDHIIFSEEFPEGDVFGDDVWVIDPLDGTDNYSRGQPQFCVSVAHTRAGVADVAAIYDPIRDEMFTATTESTSMLNGQQIEVTTRSDPSDSSVAWAQRGVNANDEIRFNMALAEAARVFYRIRLTGSSAIETAWVAAGRFDGALFSNVKWWDHAGGGLLVQQAGGKATDVRGHPTGPDSRRCVFSNGPIHDVILRLANKHGLEIPFS
jgi:myo-inositol-1(or 4)-monophosphatase